jgi:hypothetical protein
LRLRSQKINKIDVGFVQSINLKGLAKIATVKGAALHVTTTTTKLSRVYDYDYDYD